MLLSDNTTIQADHRTTYNSIVQPNRVFTISQYYLRYWLPLLKPSLAWLIIALQQRCYWNQQQSWAQVSQKKLAQDTGLSERTIRNLLHEEYTGWFTTNRKQYKYDINLGRKVRDRNIYTIYQDDPLIPTHQIGLAALLKENVNNIDDTLLTLSQMNGRILAKKLKALATTNSLPPQPEGTVKAVVENLLETSIHSDTHHLCETVQHRLTQGQGLSLLGTQYFRLHWVPLLGPSLAWVVMILRNNCYYNLDTGEVRDECMWKKAELRQALGVSINSLNNLLKHPYSHKFITDKGSTRHKYQFKIKMWQDQEPLTPTDEIKLKLDDYDIDPATGQIGFLSVTAKPKDFTEIAVSNSQYLPLDDEKLGENTVSNSQYLPLDDRKLTNFAARDSQKLPSDNTGLTEIAASNSQILPLDDKKLTNFAAHEDDTTHKNCRTDKDSLKTFKSNNHQKQEMVDDDVVIILSILDLLGIRPPTRDDLALLAHVTIDYLHLWLAWDEKENKNLAETRHYGPGWIVIQLRSGLYPPPYEFEAEVATDVALFLEQQDVDNQPQENELNKLWHSVLGQLQLQMTKATYNTWVKDTQLIAKADNKLTIAVKSVYAKDWLENRLYDTIFRTVSNVLGEPRIGEVEFVLQA